MWRGTKYDKNYCWKIVKDGKIQKEKSKMYPQIKEYKQVIGKTVLILCKVQRNSRKKSKSLLFGRIWVQPLHDKR